MSDRFSDAGSTGMLNQSALLPKNDNQGNITRTEGINLNNTQGLPKIGSDSMSQGLSAYNPPPTLYYKNECQVKLDYFQGRLKNEAGAEKFQRGSKILTAAQSENSDQEEVVVKAQTTTKDLLGLSEKAPQDATGCTSIQTLKQYVDGVTSATKNPRKQFFELSRGYYLEKYNKDNVDNKKIITVKSYLITEDYQNYVKDLSMDIIQTNQGCMPIVKTYEWNAYNKNKFVKALKFYNYRTDCKKREQIIVDEGVMHENFRTYDTSLLHFGNTILFYKREENWHKLQQYDVVKNELVELEGYQIEEPIGQEIRYHIIFSKEFGVDKKNALSKQGKISVHEFLRDKFVIAQSYRITEQLQYINMNIVMWSMSDMSRQLAPSSGQHKVLEEAIQYVGHLKNPQTNVITFMAIDPFASHEFHLDPQLMKYSDFTTYHGNNELQMMNREYLLDPEKTSQWKHENLAPFLKHQNPQFLIQRETVTLNVIEKNKKVEQYYYISHDSQFQLIYPNYLNQEQKNQVIFQIARKHQYNQNPDEDYSYQDDYDQRQRDYRSAIYKKISHICNDDYRSKNYMKRAEHLRMILEYPRPLSIHDKIILSTDQERSNIYVYQSNVVTGNNEIEIYSYENNIAKSSAMRTLPKQQQLIIIDEISLFGKQASTKKVQKESQCYYLNTKYKNMISSKTHIKSQVEDPSDNISQQLTHRIEKNDKDMFMVVEGKDGKYINVRIKLDYNTEDVKCIVYFRSKSNYIFVFTLVNEKEKFDRKHTYFFVKKTVKEVEEMGLDNHQCLIKMEQQITVLIGNTFEGTKKEILQMFTRNMTFKDLIEFQKEPQHNYIHIQFETLYDMQAKIEFIPFIYQDKKNQDSHNLLVLDIEKMQVVQKTCINSNLEMRKYIRKSEAGFSCYTLTRTSEIFNQKQGFFTTHNNPIYQIVKYQVTGQYYVQNLENENPAACTLELSEYCVKFSNYEKNLIQLIGRKQLLLSEFAQAVRKSTFEDILMIPYFDKKGEVKGSQIILKEDGQTINLLDQDINNIYHQNSKLLQFGHQKFLTNEDNHDEYILVVSVQFKQLVYMKGNFENNEAYYILNKIQKKLLSQQLAKFEYFVLNDDFDQLMREEFYQPQEVLQGKTICDLCINFPKEIAHGLKQKEEVYKRIDGSLIDEITNNEQSALAFYLKVGLCEENLIVQTDFNFVSSLRLAMELNSNQSVKILLKKVFELNTKQYQEMMMLDLPKMLQQNKIERIYPFLERDYEEYLLTQKDQDDVYTSKIQKNEFCNFEQFLCHPDLPPFANQRKQYHIKESFADFHNAETEIIQEIVEKDPYMTWGVQSFENEASKVFNQKNIEVEHSLIDFQKVIIGEKIRDVQEEGFRNVNFNDQHLAGILYLEDDALITFYNLETIRKLVDFQFVRTKAFLELMLQFYVGGFMLPFVISISTDNLVILNVAYTLCFFTQIFFFLFELIQLKEQRLDYFKDFWNLIDTSQFVIFVLLYVIKMLSQFQTDTTMEILLQGILLYQCFYKVNYFIRIYDSYCFIMTMIAYIASECFAYVMFVVVSLFGFVKIYQLLHTGINDPGNEYEQIQSEFIQRSIQVYKNAAGEITAPNLDDIMSARLEGNAFTYTLIFGFVVFMWICQQLFFGVAGTFFIAQVIESYEKHYAKFPMYHYKTKAKYNEECFQIMDLFTRQRNYKVIFFSIDKELKKEEDTMWLGITSAVQRFQVDMQNKKKQQDKKSDKVREDISIQQKQTLEIVKESIEDQKKMERKMEELHHMISMHMKKCCGQQF